MLMIDRYELSLSGHETLIKARDSLALLDSHLQKQDERRDPLTLRKYATALRISLDRIVEDAQAVDGRDAFMRQACDWGFTALAPIERVLIQSLRCSSAEGAKEIHEMVERTARLKPHIRTDI